MIINAIFTQKDLSIKNWGEECFDLLTEFKKYLEQHVIEKGISRNKIKHSKSKMESYFEDFIDKCGIYSKKQIVVLKKLEQSLENTPKEVSRTRLKNVRNMIKERENFVTALSHFFRGERLMKEGRIVEAKKDFFIATEAVSKLKMDNKIPVLNKMKVRALQKKNHDFLRHVASQEVKKSVTPKFEPEKDV